MIIFWAPFTVMLMRNIVYIKKNCRKESLHLMLGHSQTFYSWSVNNVILRHVYHANDPYYIDCRCNVFCLQLSIVFLSKVCIFSLSFLNSHHITFLYLQFFFNKTMILQPNDTWHRTSKNQTHPLFMPDHKEESTQEGQRK